MQIKLLAEGANMKPGPALSQQLGPAGININNVIKAVNEATSSFKGLTVPVILDVDMGTKEFEITVSSPPVSGLIKRELGIEKGSATQKKLQVANASIEQIINVAKQKLPSLLCNDLKTAVKTVVGTCVTLGILIENKPAKEIEGEIDSGKYDNEINNEITECSPEKREELDNYFNDLHSKQEKAVSAEKAEAEEAAEKKKEANPAEAAPSGGEVKK